MPCPICAASVLDAGVLVIHRQCDVSRHRLLLSAVHDPAALCDARQNGAGAAGGSKRPRLFAAAGVLAGDVSAVVAGRRGRGVAVLHSDRRRIRNSRPAGGVQFHDDRPALVAGILHQQGLAGGLGGRGGVAGAAAGAVVAVRPAAAPPTGRRAMMAPAPNKLSPFNIVSLALGLALMYLPIVILVIYSFNASRLVTVWGGWSLRWYSEFFHDRAMLEAALMSFRVAAVSATLATLLGTLAAVALTRGTPSKGRPLFAGMLYAPPVMPEVITGLSLLLLFVGLNADRCFWTVTIAP